MSGLIGLAIIGIWLVVLVPMWLNRHEADDATRSMDSFSTAMRVLSRRSPSKGDRRYVVMPRRDNLGVTVDNNPGATTTGRRFSLRPRTPVAVGSTGRARLMARRRRLATVVLGLLLVLLVTSTVGLTSWWYELAVGLAAAGYLIHLRNEAIRLQEVQRRRRARAARAVASSEQWDAQPAYRLPVASRPQPMLRDDEVLPAAPVSATGTENGSRWEPVPVPLPTYVSKPVVQRPAASAAPRADVDATRTIDLTRPGAWTEAAGAADGDVEIDHRHLLLDETGSGRIASSAGAPPSPYAAAHVATAADEDDELDHILERRRAVGD